MHETPFLRRIVPAALAALTCAALLDARTQPARVIPSPQGTHTENGLAGYAKILCSGVFVSERTPEDVARGSAYFFMPRPEQSQAARRPPSDAAATQPRKPHYFRIQGAGFLIELDNSGGNHIHSVWRDFNGDWGRDILGEHYSEAKGNGHSHAGAR